MKKTLILPIVHLNGTSRKELIAMRCKASNCLREAIEELSAMGPNGRDYYPVQGLFDQARDQHVRRLEVLKGVYREIAAEVVALSDDEPLPGES